MLSLIKFYSFLIVSLLNVISLDQSHAMSLSEKDLSFFKKNDFKTIIIPIENEIWPKVIIYTKVKTTTLNCMALFLALDHQKNYLPNMLKSTPVKQVDSLTVHTKYLYDLPWPIPNSTYIHSSTLHLPEKIINQGLSYSANWKMIQSDSTEKVDGNVIFYPFEGTTYMKYSIIVTPLSFLAPLLKKTMIEDVKSSIKAIKNHIETVSSSKPKLLNKYKSYILRSLNGEYVYIKK